MGTFEEVKSRFGEKDTLDAVKEYIRELTAADKELRRDVTIKLSQDKIIAKNLRRSYNGGYLFLQKVYHELGLDKICRKIEKKHRNKYLAKKVNRGGKHFSPGEIIGTLQDMNFLCIPGEGYIPTYTRTDLTNHLHGPAGFRTDTQIVSRQKMKKIINETKNIAKD